MGRIIWIDAAKGYAITLVVFGHVLGGAVARGWLGGADGDAANLVYDYIYSFHMPLFFIISGALGIKSMRTDPSYAIISRIGSIAWPYVFWGMISILIWPLISQFTVDNMHDSNFHEWLKRGLKALLLGQWSWFLWTLFVAQCILILALRLAPIQMVFAFSVIAFLVIEDKHLFSIYKSGAAPNAVVRYMPFLALGALIGPRIDLIKCDSNAASIAISTLLFGILLTIVFLRINQIPILWLCCGVIGSAASVIVVQSIASRSANRLMANCGAASLVVFLLHPYFQGAARELTLWAMGPSIWWQLAIPTVTGVVAPTLAFMGVERLGLLWIFRLDLNTLIWRGDRRRVNQQVSS
jgi:fucose 4-O-acetylase-like acetyltransferase